MASIEDNVLIAKEELSRKELYLKDRLYHNPKLPYSKATQELIKAQPKGTEFGTEQIQSYNDKPVMKFPVKDPVNPSQILFENFKQEPKQSAANLNQKPNYNQ